MTKLTKEARAALSPEQFAVPEKRLVPLHDADHVRMGWDAISATKDLTAAERAEGWHRLVDAAKGFGIEPKPFKVEYSAVINAMSLNIATDDHPNKMPFKGIMTRIDKPSDAPPEGSGGRLITISAGAAEKGLQSLLGMAVDYKPNLDGHDPKAKIGIITAATIDGDAIHIEGFIYANDFPEVAAEIKASKDVLGFSYEARDLYTNDPDANPVVITDCTFTGAAILLKAKAAYHSTSISANADEEIMTPELKDALDKIAAAQTKLTEDLKNVSASVVKMQTDSVSAANFLPRVEPHAAKLESCAAEMEAAGMGGDPNNGHAVILRKMAGHMRAEAAQGRMPVAWHGSLYSAAAPTAHAAAPDMAKEVAAIMAPFADSLKALGTQVADLKAAAVKDSPAPERKTLSPAISALLAKSGIEVPGDADGKIELPKLDAALKEMSVERRLETKAALRQAGLLA